MTPDRRLILGASIGLGAVAGTARAVNATEISPALIANDGSDQTASLISRSRSHAATAS
jgi:hypothetical protein